MLGVTVDRGNDRYAERMRGGWFFGLVACHAACGGPPCESNILLGVHMSVPPSALSTTELQLCQNELCASTNFAGLDVSALPTYTAAYDP